MATYTDKFSSGWATLKLEVTRESYSTSNNTSYLKCVLKITKDKTCQSYNNGGASISMTIAGTKLYSSDEFDIRSLSVGSTKTLATKYITVTHNSDGTKSVSCKANFSSGVGLGSASISNTYTCGTIPRSSSLTLSTTSLNVGSSITATLSRHNTSFVHDVEFYINDTYYKKYTGVATSRSYTIPTTWYNYMSASTSCTAYCRVTTRNSSGTQIGDKVTKSFTVKIPSSIKPTTGTITLNPYDIKTKDGVSRNILVKGKNKLEISVSGWSAGTGSGLKSYTYSGEGIASTTSSTSVVSSSNIKPSISESSTTLTYKVTYEDKRGRTNSKSATCTCYNYEPPSISLNSVFRCNSQGEKYEEGTFIKCDYTVKYSSVNNTNKIYSFAISGVLNDNVTYNSWTTSTASGIVTATGSAIIKNCSTASSYKLNATFIDNYGGTVSSSTKSVLSSTRILNIPPDGNGIAFGKKSENIGFECAWNSRFYKHIYLNGDLHLDANGAYIYGKTTNSEYPGMLRLSPNDNVIVGSRSIANKTYIYGGKDKSVTIGESEYKTDLYVTGKATGPSGFSTSSDKRVKKNIRNLDVDIVDKLQSVEYQLIGSEDNKTHYGFIAQDVAQVLIDANIDPSTCGIIDTISSGEDKQYVLTYTEFVPLLVTKCQNLQTEITELRKEIMELKKMIK